MCIVTKDSNPELYNSLFEDSIINELEKWLVDNQINNPFMDEMTIIEVRNKLAELKEGK